MVHVAFLYLEVLQWKTEESEMTASAIVGRRGDRLCAQHSRYQALGAPIMLNVNDFSFWIKQTNYCISWQWGEKVCWILYVFLILRCCTVWNLWKFCFEKKLENAPKDASNIKFMNPMYLPMLHLWFYLLERSCRGSKLPCIISLLPWF